MTDPTPTAGARLKAERERRNLSAQKAADELHLDGWIIDALEADDYGRMGPSVYAKGHLKRYAALLGLPVAEIMQEYESHGLALRPPPPPTAQARMPLHASADSNLPWPQILAALGVALVLLGVFWWKPWHLRGESPPAGSPKAATPGAAPAAGRVPSGGTDLAPTAPPPSLSTPPAPGSAVPSETAAPAALPAPAPAGADAAAGVGRARLRMSFSADSWVDIHDASGRRAFAGNGRANSVRTIAGMAPMRVYLGFASGVQLEINNRAVAIGSQFVAGDVARFEAGADGVLRRDSHSAPALGAPSGQPPNARPTG